MSTNISRCLLVVLFSLLVRADAQTLRVSDFQQLRRDYQVLAKDYQTLLSEIYGKQADYAELNRKILTDLVKDFIGDLKDGPSSEKGPDGPLAKAKKYADYALNLRDELKVLLGNADLRDRLTELDLRGQNLSFRGRAMERNQLPPGADGPAPPPRPLQPVKPPPAAVAPRRTDFSELDDAILVNRWRDMGNRAFSNKAEEDAFYRRHPEYVKYRKIAELRSPADDLPADKGAAVSRDAMERARDVMLRSLDAVNRCSDAYQACVDPCINSANVVACIARCRECTSEMEANSAAQQEFGRQETLWLTLSLKKQ